MIKAITGHATDTMLEHYQHIGAGLVEEMARRLGSGMGEAKALPLGPAHLVDAKSVLSLAESMTCENWEAKRDEIIKLTKQNGP
jgi:hypothetical protein